MCIFLETIKENRNKNLLRNKDKSFSQRQRLNQAVSDHVCLFCRTIIATLDKLAVDGDSKAAVYKLYLMNFEFIVTLVAIEHLLSALVPLSKCYKLRTVTCSMQLMIHELLWLFFG
jgi:hypothetical protein